MEFNEKLQELRKSRGLTQEELAEALFVSRTAVSKWESGRGYPNIDSLKELSRFFSVTIDELICPEEILSAAENEKKEFVSQSLSFLCGSLDMFQAALLFIPVFGNGPAYPASVSLFSLTGINPWIKIVFAAVIGAAALNGVIEAAVRSIGRPVLSRRALTAGMVMSIAACAVFVLSRQPYAGLMSFAVLVIKGCLIIKAKSP